MAILSTSALLAITGGVPLPLRWGPLQHLVVSGCFGVGGNLRRAFVYMQSTDPYVVLELAPAI